MNRNKSSSPVWLETISQTPEVLERITPNQWSSLREDRSASELDLQEFLVKCPDVLPFQEFSSVFSPAICIGREVSTPVGPIDLIYISDQGRIVVVETKLHKNPESRREVVAQLLDYCSYVSEWNYRKLSEIAKDFITKRYSGVKYDGLHSFVTRSVPRSEEDLYEPPMDEDRFIFEVDRNLQRGEILGLIVGDSINERVVTLVEYANARPGMALELGLVELAFFRRPNEKSPLIVVPSIVQKTSIIARTVVDVRVDSLGAVTVNVEEKDESKSVITGKSKPMISSEEQFFEYVRERAPDSETHLRKLANQLLSMAENSGGVYEVYFRVSSLNLGWRENPQQIRRMISIWTSGAISLSVLYLKSADREDVTDKMEELAKGLLSIPEGRGSAEIHVSQSNIDRIAKLIKDIETQVTPMLEKM
ncbi:MAG: hypothetical protein NUW37_11610 [Planctomycetes bacterium]|nr:hypothetical protein [Planctomycetota bacterium]